MGFTSREVIDKAVEVNENSERQSKYRKKAIYHVHVGVVSTLSDRKRRKNVGD